MDGRNARVLADRETHNCNLSRGTDRVSPRGRNPGRGRAKPVDRPTGPQRRFPNRRTQRSKRHLPSVHGVDRRGAGGSSRPSAGSGGSGEASATTALTAPSAPQNVTATPGDGEMTITWSAPSSDGRSAGTLYRVYHGKRRAPVRSATPRSRAMSSSRSPSPASPTARRASSGCTP